MSSQNQNADKKAKDPHLPRLHRAGDLIAPTAPKTIAQTGLDTDTLADLAVKLAFTVPRLTTDWMAERLYLSIELAAEVLEQLCLDGLAEVTMRSSGIRAHYRITERGRAHATRSLEVCGYIGPAPVRLESYGAMLRWQFSNSTQVKPAQVTKALSGLVLPSKTVHLTGLAASSGRSLFIYGPPGNGKSSLGRQIHSALVGDYWIPHCINVGRDIIRIYDNQIHEAIEIPEEHKEHIDQRWIRIRRPLVVVGGELNLEMLDLIYSPTLRYYEAPPHLKSNGGVFLIDDFGRERISPTQLLNRFITPMEHQIDYFTLATSQKIQVPLRHVLIIATNLDPQTVTDPAFLRRMGYRVYLGPPTPEEYAKIFKTYAKKHGVDAPTEIIEDLLKRYQAENRELRSCEPRDLIERARDICSFSGKSLELNRKVLDIAWEGYFGGTLLTNDSPQE